MVEIKCSRVIANDTGGADNLLDELLNSSLELVPFDQAFSTEFDCNIQQVKPDCFDRLYYYLVFADCIVSFRMTKDVFALNAEMVFAQTLALAVKDKIVDDNFAQVLGGMGVAKGMAELVQAMVQQNAHAPYIVDAQKQCHCLAQLKYSDKQHRGNSGEGQFHITHKNLAHHLEHNFVGVHNYTDFKQALAGISCRTRKIKAGV